MTRHIKLSSIDNLRDFGGYATACGRGLKSGRLFRAAAQSQASDEDLEALAGLGLNLIVDLRRPDERTRAPCRRWPGFAAQVLDNDLGATMEGWEYALKGADPTPEFFHDMHLAWYRKAPFEPRLIDLYSRYFEALAESGGPVLIHCAVGKDRTGLLAALTHVAAGVHRDDMMADYLATNHGDFHEARAPYTARIIERHSGKAPTDETVRVAMSVRGDYLETALAAIDERYGSVDAYLSDALGLDASRRAMFEQRLLG